MQCRNRILVIFSFLALSLGVFVIAVRCRPARTEVQTIEKSKWNLVFESKDIPTEKGFRAVYRVYFENSDWKKEDPDYLSISGSAKMEMDGEVKQVQLRCINHRYSYFRKSGSAYENFAYVIYAWELKGDSPIKNDGVYLSKWVPVRIIEFPFKLGSRWHSGDIPGIWGVEKKHQFTTRWHYSVTAEEEVTVPAGTFQCMRVEVKKKTENAPPEQAENWDNIRTRKWYAKGVGVVKSITDDGNVKRRTVAELVSFTRGPDRSDQLSPALTEIKSDEIPMTPGQVALWQVGDNVFEGLRLCSPGVLDYYNGVWEGKPRAYGVISKGSTRRVIGPRTPLFETGKVYDFPLTIGKTWEAGGGFTRKVVGPEIVTARLIPYLALKIETRQKDELVAEEWIARGVGPVRRVVYQADGTSRSFELDMFLHKTGDRAEYVLPWRVGEKYGLTNPFGIGSSERGHKGPGRFAYDFGLPVGVVIVAARAGVVVAYRESSDEGGFGNKYFGKENQLIIRHDDGSLAHYVHLEKDSIIPELGDRVEQGQKIARTGLTGWCSGAHLHFAVTRGGPSMPFAFRDAEGRFGLLEWSKVYTRTAK
ncbi:MAG: M23 family metallopeptidase [Planctomycetota bacterium]|nr:MAG: M23 family metallopeptidase [Planctomycetota bacterium]